MPNRSETNAQNSKTDPKTPPSKNRSEPVINKQTYEAATGSEVGAGSETGLHGETLRPSEREDSYAPKEMKRPSPLTRAR